MTSLTYEERANAKIRELAAANLDLQPAPAPFTWDECYAHPKPGQKWACSDRGWLWPAGGKVDGEPSLAFYLDYGPEARRDYPNRGSVLARVCGQAMYRWCDTPAEARTWLEREAAR